MDLKKARRIKKFTLRALGKVMNFSHEAIRNYENGLYPPRPEVWKKLKFILELPGEFSDYFDRENAGTGNKKYTEDSQCSVAGCTEKPVAKWLCRRHYTQARAKK